MTQAIAISPDALLVKTDKGIDEIRNRTHRLAARLRPLLVLIDGTRRVADIHSLARNLGGGEEAVASLVREGFVAPAESAEPAGDAIVLEASAADMELMRLRGAKAAMLRYVRVGAGLIEARTLNERIDRVHSVDDVPACLGYLCNYLERTGRHDAAVALRGVVSVALGAGSANA